MHYDYSAGTSSTTISHEEAMRRLGQAGEAFAFAGTAMIFGAAVVNGVASGMSAIIKEGEPPSPTSKYDPDGARQMWQPGYLRIQMRGERRPLFMPRYNQVQQTLRVRHGRRGAR